MIAVLFGALGLIAGVAGVYSQKRTVSALSPANAELALALVVGGAVFRLVLFLLMLLLAFRQGLAPGLAGLFGLLIGRWLILVLENLKE
jgi:hypothetical protein